MSIITPEKLAESGTEHAMKRFYICEDNSGETTAINLSRVDIIKTERLAEDNLIKITCRIGPEFIAITMREDQALKFWQHVDGLNI